VRVVPALAVAVTGIALYLSRAVLDQVAERDHLTRVALLPPWQVLAAFAALAAIGLVWLDRQVAARSSAGHGGHLGSVTLPLLGLGLLVVPFVPVLPDVLPALQVLAGPLRVVLWVAVLAQLAWVLWEHRTARGWRPVWSPARIAMAVAIVTALVSGTAAWKLTGTVLTPNGDEPHYLVIAQSLWRDGDLKIENNHARGDYKEYFAPDLEPHYLTRGADQEIYSIHPVGLPFLIAPVYGLGGYPAVVALIVLLAATAVGLVSGMVATFTDSPGAAIFAAAATAATAPFLFNSFTVYPEIGAALAVAIAFVLSVWPTRRGWLSWLPVGVTTAALPWLSTKYAPMSAALVAIALARLLWANHPGSLRPAALARAAAVRSSIGPALAILLPYLLSLAGWFAFFEAIWGSPWPQAPYGDLVQTNARYLVFGAPGLIFDQEYGLLAYAPVFVIACAGMGLMWRAGGEEARRAVEIAMVGAALLGTVGAFRIWWGGSAAPGRPIASALPLLMLPMAVAYRATAPVLTLRAACQLLLWISIGVAGTMLFAQNGFLTANGRDGTSSLLEYLSPRWPVWTAAPSFILHEPPTALGRVAVWIAAAVAAAVALSRISTARRGLASIAAIATVTGAVTLGVLVAANLPADPAWPDVDVRARARAPLLQEYDATARPVGVEYAPLRIVPAADVTRHAVLEVLPGTRTEPQPLRVLHNGRFSLPAGEYRLEIDWSGARSGETVGLQLGRTGDAWQSWVVEPRPGERFTAPISLPIDVGFVGLRGTPDLERVIGRIAFVPVTVVDLTRRPRTPVVIGASQAPGVDLFYADENALVEKGGFWVRGRRTTQVMVRRGDRSGPLRLRVNSGLIQNRVRVATSGWARTVVLQPRQPDEIVIPVEGRALVTLRLSAELEFVPQALDPASSDPRPLGIWIEVVP
jgi:hypothetical protein